MRYQRFLDVSQASDIQGFQHALTELAAEMGFGLFGALMRVHSDKSFFMLSNAPAEFAAKTTKPEDAQRDPVLERLRSNACFPFVYDQAFYVDAGAADLWEEQAAFGYKTGIIVSQHVPGERHFCLGFDRAEPLPSRDEDLTRMLADLQLVAAHAQDGATRLMRHPTPASDVHLAPREIEILRKTLEGKSLKVIARELSCEVVTVTFHLQKSSRKLGVNTRYLAAQKALALGLI